MSKPMRKRARTEASAGQPQTLAVHLKALRSPLQTVTLDSQELTTSIHDLKAAYARETGVASEKLKILHSKKPCADSKTLRDLLGDGSAETESMEFSVMIMGGGVTGVGGTTGDDGERKPAAAGGQVDQQDSMPPAAPGSSLAADLAKDEFWDDLKGFLTQRLKDTSEGERLALVFREAWRSGKQT